MSMESMGKPQAPSAAERSLREGLAATSDRDAARATLLEQMGGVKGVVYSGIPLIVFVVVNALAGLVPAIVVSVGCSLVLLLVAMLRTTNLQPAVSSFIPVAISAFIAYRTGEGRDFFLLGIWMSALYGVVVALSMVLRYPLVGVVWSAVSKSSSITEWRSHRRARWMYQMATLVWVAVFFIRFGVMKWLYDGDETAALAMARLSLGWPLTIVAGVVTVLCVRRAQRILRQDGGRANAAFAQDGAGFGSGAVVTDDAGGGRNSR